MAVTVSCRPSRSSDDVDRLVDPGADERADVAGVVDGLAGDRDDPVAGQDAGDDGGGPAAGRCTSVASPTSVTGTTHCDTEATTAPGWAVATPCTVTRRVSSTTPMSRFIDRAAEHDDDLLGHREPVEHAVLVAGAHLLQARGARLVDELAEPARARDAHRARRVAGARREHADHPDVAAERDRLDAVLGLTAAARPDGRPEADHVLGHPHAEALGRARGGPTSCRRDRRGDTGGHEEHPEDERDGLVNGRLASVVVVTGGCDGLRRRASAARRSRAHASAASTPSTLEASDSLPTCARRRRARRCRRCRGSAIAPSWKASTQTSLAAL